MVVFSFFFSCVLLFTSFTVDNASPQRVCLEVSKHQAWIRSQIIRTHSIYMMSKRNLIETWRWFSRMVWEIWGERMDSDKIIATPVTLRFQVLHVILMLCSELIILFSPGATSSQTFLIFVCQQNYVVGVFKTTQEVGWTGMVPLSLTPEKDGI